MTDKQKSDLIGLLLDGQSSCVIAHGADIRIFRERGVKNLYRLLKNEPDFLHGSVVADKVVGKAAAALMVLGGVADVYAEVISRPALDLLNRNGITVSFATTVPHIINRTKTGWCPLEIRCHECRSPQECLQQIEEFINTQNHKEKP